MRTAVLGQGTKDHERPRCRDETGQEWGMKERRETMDTGRMEGGRVQCLQNQSERHVEKLIFLILTCQSSAAWRLGGPEDEEMEQEWSKGWRPRP